MLSRSLSELDSSSPNCRQIPVDLTGRPLTLDTLVLRLDSNSLSVKSSMAGGGGGEMVGGMGDGGGDGGRGEGEGEYTISSSIVEVRKTWEEEGGGRRGE